MLLSGAKREEGTAAIEFALLTPFFLLLLFGIIEFSIFSWKKTILKNVIFESARHIQVGDIQRTSNPALSFAAIYCANTPSFIDCGALNFDVRSYSGLSALSYPPAVYDADGNPTNFTFDAGYQNEIVTVRATMTYDFATPMLKEILQPDGRPAVVLGYTIFQNEPFGCLDEC